MARTSRTQLTLAVAFALVIGARPALAQCPDGTPPPCAGQRRAGPVLVARRYIVVPFGNVTRAQDLDWLRDASVNLLTLEIGRWNDVEVVNDKRVGDLLREMPSLARAGTLTLNDGLAIARRAGAGMLVMGDFIKLGRTTRLVANVFDARSGSRLRSVEQQAGADDSLLSAFGPLARGVLDVPPPPDAQTGDIGTTHLDAYEAYLAGVRALNRFDLPEARAQLTHALALDSTFALAHLELSLVFAWGEQSLNGPEGRLHALAAQRFGRALPPRERALIEARVAFTSGDPGRACQVLAPLVARDSSDVQAVYNLGDCAYHDLQVVKGASDSVPGSLPYGWNLSLRMLTRALELDPTFHVAFAHIVDILRSTEVTACFRPAPEQDCEEWSAAVLRDHDTLVIRPVSMQVNFRGYLAQVDSAARQKPVLANLAQARRIAEQWVAADTTNPRAQYGLATVLLSQGDVAGADAALRHAATPAYAGFFPQIRTHLEVAIKLGRGAEARAWFDSLVKAIPDDPSVLVTRGNIDAIFARLGRVTRGYGAAAARIGQPRANYLVQVPRVLLGIPGPDAGAAEAAYWAAMADTATCDFDCRLDRIMPTLGYGLRMPRPSWPAFARRPADFRLVFAGALSRHDTATLRRTAFYHDSLARRNVGMGWPEYGWAALAAEGYLALGDSAAALREARFYVDTALATSPLMDGLSSGMLTAELWPRMMLLRADLAAAAGSREEALAWYDRVLDLWADADADLAPDIARIRARRASVAGR